MKAIISKGLPSSSLYTLFIVGDEQLSFDVQVIHEFVYDASRIVDNGGSYVQFDSDSDLLRYLHTWQNELNLNLKKISFFVNGYTPYGLLHQLLVPRSGSGEAYDNDEGWVDLMNSSVAA